MFCFIDRKRFESSETKRFIWILCLQCTIRNWYSFYYVWIYVKGKTYCSQLRLNQKTSFISCFVIYRELRSKPSSFYRQHKHTFYKLCFFNSFMNNFMWCIWSAHRIEPSSIYFRTVRSNFIFVISTYSTTNTVAPTLNNKQKVLLMCCLHSSLNGAYRNNLCWKRSSVPQRTTIYIEFVFPQAQSLFQNNRRNSMSAPIMIISDFP